MLRNICYLLVLLSAMFLIACSTTTDKASDRAALCKELKSRIIFNGATGNQLVAGQQRTELNKLERNYQDQGC